MQMQVVLRLPQSIIARYLFNGYVKMHKVRYSVESFVQNSEGQSQEGLFKEVKKCVGCGL
jgi:hypothetical protein